MLKEIIEQFFQSAMTNKEKRTFPSKPETNPKGRTSSSSIHDTFRKVNATITLSSGKEIDNHVRDNFNEKSNMPATIIVDNSSEYKEDEPTITVTTTTPPM